MEECGLTWSGCVSLWFTNLGPAIPKDVAKIPACLYRLSKKVLVRWLPIAFVLANVKQHFG